MIETQLSFSRSIVVGKPVRRVEFVISKKFPDRAVEAVCTGLDRGVKDGTTRATEIGAEVCCLDLELLDRVHWRKNDKVCSVEEVHSVGVVVDTIQQVVVLGWFQTIRSKGARCRIASRVSLRGVDAGAKLRQEREIASIQRKAIHCPLSDHLTD